MVTDRAILNGDVEGANKSYAMSCIECGCCAYVCPARRPLVQSQRLAKKLIRKNKLTPA
jgi:electron transport complex protein RnfC